MHACILFLPHSKIMIKERKKEKSQKGDLTWLALILALYASNSLVLFILSCKNTSDNNIYLTELMSVLST